MSTLTQRPQDRARVNTLDSCSSSRLADLLTRQLQVPSDLPRPRVSPQLAYGRHRGPSPATSRMAAVAVAIYWDPWLGWTLPLTQRPSHLQHHAGQICLPGGRIESGEGPLQAAMREFGEELGVAPQIEFHCGELSRQYVYASGNLVHPVVAIIAPPSRPWSPDPLEVQEVIPMPLRILRDPRHRTTMVKQRLVQSQDRPVDRLVFRAEAIKFGPHLVWGATALILDQLAQILPTR